ncbi:BlaI/MecI/CopY family transcriptional regulator [Terriglobus roseus]|uniref:Predicted transcriptional regulator n=1 Tax=Terriglobus roseus TaxID=392734 RepID=A0A1H4KPP2_9BACT|nr:BlaI/MecI/CopY family transcriptional regulator [Terriglobus roseus]SEB60065.1 Predicted transcriptional regulator [Terriglobus roseus]
MSAATVSKSVDKQALTPLELEIMQVLWSAGPSTASEVVPQLAGNLAYNTVQTMLQVLLRKGRVKRVAEGRAYRYRAAVTRERAAGSAISDLVKRMFGGSAEAMLLAMVDAGQVGAEDLQRARKALQAAEKNAEAAAKEARG